MTSTDAALFALIAGAFYFVGASVNQFYDVRSQLRGKGRE